MKKTVPKKEETDTCLEQGTSMVEYSNPARLGRLFALRQRISGPSVNDVFVPFDKVTENVCRFPPKKCSHHC